MIVSFNFYYARPGLADAVLQQRLRASDVRVRIHLPYGRVLSRTAGSGELPDVIWEHAFSDVEGHHADMAVRAASPEFEAIRAGMRPLYRRFERPLFEVSGEDAAVDRLTSGVVTLDWVFCAPEKSAEVLAILQRHADLHAERGLSRGRLLRLIAPGNDLPQVVWQRDYSDSARYELTRAELDASAELQDWQSAVRELAPDVRPSIWIASSRGAQ